MKKVLALLPKVPGWALDKLRYAYERYPVQTLAVIASGVELVATQLGLVVDKQNIITSVGWAVPFLIAARVAHHKVEPVKGVEKPKPLAKRVAK